MNQFSRSSSVLRVGRGSGFALMMRTTIFRRICFVLRNYNVEGVPSDGIARSSMCCLSGTYGSLEREEPEDPNTERDDLAFSRAAGQEEKL